MATTKQNTAGGGPRLSSPLPRNTSVIPARRGTTKSPTATKSPTTINQNTIDSDSPLLRLPAELRNKIYEYALSATPYTVEVSATGFEVPGLLLTNRQIRLETRAMFYSKHDFAIHMTGEWRAFELPETGYEVFTYEHAFKFLIMIWELEEVPDWHYVYGPDIKEEPTVPSLSGDLLLLIGVFMVVSLMYMEATRHGCETDMKLWKELCLLTRSK